MAYATAWASGDPDQVVALYDAAAIRDDSIAGTRTEGSQAVRTTATDFFVAHSDATWELLLPFGAGTTSGGIFAIGDADGCSVRATVVLHIKSGKIVQEKVYYDGASLLAGCWFS